MPYCQTDVCAACRWTGGLDRLVMQNVEAPIGTEGEHPGAPELGAFPPDELIGGAANS